MTHEMQWKCLSKWNAWTFMKLSAIMPVIGLGMDAYLLLPHGGRHARRVYSAPLFSVLEWPHRDHEFRTDGDMATDAGHDDLPLRSGHLTRGDPSSR